MKKIISNLIFFLFITAHAQPSIITIGFAGDTMLGRLVSPAIEQKGPASSWGNLLPLLQSNDFNVINLETTFTTSSKPVPKVFNFKSNPKNVSALTKADIGIVNIANNHILDFGDDGLLQTLATLDAAHIKHVGAGINIQQAKEPVIIKKNGISVGILGYTDNEPTWLADNTKPGTNYIKVGDIESVTKDIQKVRNLVDVLIISIHWGPNMLQRPTQEFRTFAHQLIDAGVDIIHGHSSHIFQGIEVYKHKLIMYDTGDFVDDYAVDPLLRNDQSLFFQVVITKNGPIKVLLIPTIINNMQVNKAKGKNYKEIMERIKKLSFEFDTKIHDNRVMIQNES
jgi:poly-gamma-glutamate capsule biosynthesis protein CapA/YwtB (metallophosphatase superfamily)